MWKKTQVVDLKLWRDGAKRTAVLHGADGSVVVRPIQLVIPLEFDQGGGGNEGSLELSIYLKVREVYVSVSNK